MAQPAPTTRPQGGTVVGGTASIAQSAAQTTVTQATQRAAIDWRSFDVGSGHTVQYQQPNASAVILNRVTGPDPSQIAGRIQANGQVVITNQSGVVFHQGAQVNAAGLVVSAAGITNSNFMAGRMVFDQAPKPDAAVTNAGTITVKETGLAALVAPRVANSGVINARMGRVALAGAETHTVDLYGDGLLAIDVTRQVRQAPRGADGKPATALVTNTGTVIADGGTVQITAAAADGIVQNLVQAGGTIRADALGGKPGQVVIAGVGGSVRIEGAASVEGGGTMTATATGTVTVASGARVTANGQGGGGSVNIGSRTSGNATVEAGAQLTANGLGTGRGGKVNVLSAGTTRMAGRIEARGGAQGGDGGSVEVSGAKVELTADTKLDTSAPAGKLGNTLIDPGSTAISDNSNGGYTDVDTVIPTSTLVNQPTDVTVTATNNLYVLSSFTNPGSNGLTFTAGNSLLVNAGVTIDTLGRLTLGAGTPGISLLGSVAARNSTGLVFNTSGPVTQGAGSIVTTPVLTGNVGSLALTNAGNQISAVGYNPFTSGGSLAASVGGISVTSSVPLSVQGAYFDAGTIVPNGQAITFTADTINIPASGFGNTNASAPGGSITLQPLSPGKALELSTTVVDNAALHVDPASLNRLDTSIVQLGGAGTGAISVAPNGVAINLATAVTGYGTLRLVGTGDITQGASLTLGPRPSSATNIALYASGANITLDNGGNTIPVVSGLAGTGDVALESGNSLVVNGPITATGLVNLSSLGTVGAGVATMTLNASITAGTTVRLDTSNGTDLSTSGTLVQAAGTITGTQLIGSAQAATLPGPNNIRLGTYSTSGDFTFTGSGAIQIGGALSVGGTLSLTANGAITQTAESSVTAGVLTVPSSTQTVLDSPSNVISTLGNYSSGVGGLQLTTQNADGVPLLVDGIVSAPAVTQIGITTDRVTIRPGSQLNTGGTVAFIPLSPGREVELVGTAGQQSVSRLSLTQANINAISATTLLLGDTNTGAITLGATNNAIDLTGHANYLSVTSGSTVGEGTNATVTAQRLSGYAQSFSLPNANNFSQLGSIIATNGAIAVNNTGSLSVVGLLQATGNVQLSASNAASGISFIDQGFLTGSASAANLILNSGTGGLSFASSSPTTVGALTVVTTGAVTQTGTGALQSTLLSGNAASLALTGSSNVITTLGGLSTTGATSLVTNSGLSVTGVNIASAYNLAANSLSVTGNINATGTTTLTVPGTVTVTGAFGANTLSGTTGPASFGGTSTINQISGLTVGGAFALNDTASLAITGAFNAGANGITLTAPSLTQTAAGTITAGTLAGTIAGATSLLTAANAIGSLGAFSNTGGAFGLNDTVALTVTGPLNVGGNTATLVTPALTQTAAGPITAATLTGSSTGATTLTAASNAITNLGPYTSQGFALTDSAGLALVGAVNVGTGAFTLNAPSLTQTTGSTLTAGLLAGTIGSAVTLQDPGNAIAGLGPFAAAGLTLTDSAPLAVVGAVNLGTGAFALTAPSVSQSAAGVITAGSFSGSFTGPAALGIVANNVGTLGSVTSAGGFAFAAAGALNVNGPVNDTVSVALTSAGTLTISSNVSAPRVSLTSTGGALAFSEGTVSAPTELDLAAATPIGQPGGSAIATGLLTISGPSATLNAANNDIAALGAVSTTGAFSLTDGRSLTVSGPVNVGGAATLAVTGDLTLAGNVTAATLGLTASGSVSQTGGTVLATSVSGSAGGVFSLGSATNRFSQVGPVTAGTAILLTDAASLSVTGAIDPPDVTMNVTGNLDIANTITAGRLTLNVTGAVTESGSGYVSAGTLAGTVGSLAIGRASVTTLGALTGTGALTLADDTRGFTTTAIPLTVTGPVVSSTSVTLSNQGPITLSGDVTAPAILLSANRAAGIYATSPGNIVQTAGTVSGATTLQAGDAVTQTGGSFAGSLAGSAGGAVSLTQANALSTLGAFTAGGVFALANGANPLTIAGPLNDAGYTVSLSGGALSQAAAGVITAATLTGSGADVTLGAANQVANLGRFAATGDFLFSTPNTLNVTGAVSAGSGRTLTLSTAGLTFRGGSLSAPGGTVALAPYAAGAPFTLSQIATGGTVAAVNASTLQVGTTSSGDLTVTDPFNLTSVGTLALVSGGSISQSAGAVISAPVLTANGATVLLDQANAIGTLGTSSARGAFTFASASPLTVVGTVSAGTGALSLSGAGITLGTASLTAALSSGGTVTLNGGAGAITEPNGSIAAAALTGSAGSVSLTGSNQVASLGPFASTGAFALSDARGLVLGGDVSGTTVSLAAPSIARAAGTVSAGTLALNVTGDASLVTAVSTLGAVTVNGTLQLANAGAVSLAGPVTAGTLALAAPAVNLDGQVTVGTLRLSGGGVTQRAGSLQAGTVTGTAAGDLILGVNGTAAVSGIADFAATGQLVLVSVVPLTASGTVGAPSVTLRGTGRVLLPGTVLVADRAVIEALAASAGTTQPGTAGASSITQTGTATVRGSTGAATQLQLIVHRGAISLQDLAAPATALVTSMDGGLLAGNVNLAALAVNDQGGSANLAGSVAGQTGAAAAQAATISRFDPAYTLNGCAIASVSCGQVVQVTQTVETVTTTTQPEEAVVRIVIPTTIRPDIAAVQSLVRTNLFTVDLITLDILRSPTDPEFTLPNISERDY